MQDERSERLKAYRYKASVDGGTLLVRPLTEEWLGQATTLLTETFADSVGYMPMYRSALCQKAQTLVFNICTR